MKSVLGFCLAFGLLVPGVSGAATTINSTNLYAYGANIGWINWRGDVNSGAVIGDYVCSGYIYSANVGWINLGNGAPANGIHYQNNSSTDFGVNHDGFGNLRGYAYGANIGWISFESNGTPTVDLATGRLFGYIYSANCGWISLSNGYAVVATDYILPGASENGMSIAWELEYFGHTGVVPGADADSDGASNLHEYKAGTNPTNPADKLAVTSFKPTPGRPSSFTLTWSSVLNRWYRIAKSTDLQPGSWNDAGLGLIQPGGALTSRLVTDSTSSAGFYRVEAVSPLAP